MMKYLMILLLFGFLSAQAEEKKKVANIKVPERSVSYLMTKIKKRIKRFRWDSTFFHDKGWKVGGHSVNGMPLIYWTCGDPDEKNHSLVLSAVHGDEITPVYFGFRLVEWVKARPEVCKDKFIVIAPIVNPDGFLRYTRGTRTNYNKVDLNRNFDTPEWREHARHLWETKYDKQRRYFPGDKPSSQPETVFQKWLINEFQITKILSVHAPLNILDYDGPKDTEAGEFAKAYYESCFQLKKEIIKATPDLNFFAYGTFPGSLGNYAGKHLGIPTITVELPSIDYSKAMQYFADMEKGNMVFFDYRVKEKPQYLKDKEKWFTQAKADN